MSSSDSISEIKHHLLLNVLADRLKKSGFFEIEADHLEHASRPLPVIDRDGRSHMPDLVASREGKRYFFEVKTDEALFSDETEEQLRAIDEYAGAVGGEFCLVVPVESAAKAEFLLEWLGLRNVTVLYC